MITLDQDVQIGYVEADATETPNNKNNLIYLEKLEKTTQNIPFCRYISNTEALAECVDKVANPGIFDFLQAIKSETVSPKGFWLCAVNTTAGAAYLMTGTLTEFAQFRDSFNDPDHPGIKVALGFSIKVTNDDVDTPYVYSIAGPDLDGIANYNDLATKLGTQHAEINVQLTGGKLSFTTVATGSKIKIGYLEDSEVPVNDSGYLWGGANLPTYAEFKTAAAGLDNLTFVLHKLDNSELFAYNNIPFKDFDDWGAFAAALNTLSSDSVTVKYLPENRLMFTTVAKGEAASMGYVTSEQEVGDTNLATYLKLNEAGGALTIQGEARPPLNNCAELLIGAQNSAGVQNVAGNDDIHSSAELMKFFYDRISAEAVEPNAVVLSRNLNYTEAGIDVDTTKNLIDGFGQYFSSAQTNVTTGVLLIQTDRYKDDIFSDVRTSANSRNIIINYHAIRSEFLDGAVAAFICGLNWEGEKVFRNLKGLRFFSVTANKEIDNNIDEILNTQRMNCYGVMANGMPMYRNGLTSNANDVQYADTAVGLNALIIDLKDKFERIIGRGKVRMNSEGISLLYAALAGVCEKYVTNGFLAEGNYTYFDNDEGGMKTATVEPYRIEISRSFTQSMITNRTFPDIKIYVASSIYANRFKIDLSNAYAAVTAL
jgi:hypothetical protein